MSSLAANDDRPVRVQAMRWEHEGDQLDGRAVIYRSGYIEVYVLGDDKRWRPARKGWIMPFTVPGINVRN